MVNTIVIEPNKYLLVSDSNETINQLDSKKLSQADLVLMAQDNLFKKHLGIMGRYLTINQYNTYVDILETNLKLYGDLFGKLEDQTPEGKYRVVDGQVILIDVSQMDEYNKWRTRQQKPQLTPLEYLNDRWNITTDFWVEQVKDCSFRGMTEVKNATIQRKSNQKVMLTDENLPPHMHHSGITQQAKIGSMTTATGSVKRFDKEVRYDMFYNDQFENGSAVGVDKNEMDGVVDEFEVKQFGENLALDGEEPGVYHDNIPACRKYYAFIIHKND